MKIRFAAIVAAVRAYRTTIAQHHEAKAKAELNRMIIEAAKRDPLSMLFEAKYCRAAMEADFRYGNR